MTKKVFRVLLMGEKSPMYIKASSREEAIEAAEFSSMKNYISCKLTTKKEIEGQLYINEAEELLENS